MSQPKISAFFKRKKLFETFKTEDHKGYVSEKIYINFKPSTTNETFKILQMDNKIIEPIGIQIKNEVADDNNQKSNNAPKIERIIILDESKSTKNYYDKKSQPQQVILMNPG